MINTSWIQHKLGSRVMTTLLQTQVLRVEQMNEPCIGLT